MKSFLVFLATLAAAALACPAAPPPKTVVKTLTDAIRAHCPDATIEVTDDMFIAKQGTMLFTLHPQQMTGEYLPKPYQEEGPNFKGFVLKVSLEKGLYTGQLVIPQELSGPYYLTFFDGPTTDDGKNHLRINFSYGRRLDPKLKQAILDTLPKAKRLGN